MTKSALIVGVGPGLSASLARRCANEGMQVTLASRHPESFHPLAAEIGATGIVCDVVEPVAVGGLVAHEAYSTSTAARFISSFTYM